MDENKGGCLQMVSNIVTAAFTIVLAVVAYLQWWTTQIALDRALYRERAQIVIESLELSSPLTPTTPLTYALKFQNVGQSPALEVNGRWIHVGCAISPLPIGQFELRQTPDCSATMSVGGQESGMREVYGIIGANKGGTLQESFPAQPQHYAALSRSSGQGAR